MNDFTKEELEYLKWLVKDYEGEYQNSSTSMPEKIQSMIDNYCDHEYNEKSVELHAKQCCKCQKVKVL